MSDNWRKVSIVSIVSVIVLPAIVGLIYKWAMVSEEWLLAYGNYVLLPFAGAYCVAFVILWFKYPEQSMCAFMCGGVAPIMGMFCFWVGSIFNIFCGGGPLPLMEMIFK